MTWREERRRLFSRTLACAAGPDRTPLTVRWLWGCSSAPLGRLQADGEKRGTGPLLSEVVQRLRTVQTGEGDPRSRSWLVFTVA